MVSSRSMPAGRSRNRTTLCITPRCTRAKDPVALDAIALRNLEQWRARASLPPIGSTAAYVDFASQLNLGNSAPNRIEIRTSDDEIPAVVGSVILLSMMTRRNAR